MACAAAAVAIAVGLWIPDPVPLRFVEEGGGVERGTLWAYLVAVVGMLALRPRKVPWLDVFAACLLLLAMAAREADLHKAMYGISILKSRFYLEAPWYQILGALGVLAPVVLSGLWMLLRHARHWLTAPTGWSAAATSVAVMAVTMAVAKAFDRAPATLAALGSPLPVTTLHVMLALEEILELTLPLFALLAMVQVRWSSTSSHAL